MTDLVRNASELILYQTEEYAQYHALLDSQPRAIDAEFEKVAKQLKKPAAPRRKKSPR